MGPIGALCIHRTLARGRASGFVSGLGAATADAAYGALAAFGITSIAGVFAGDHPWPRLAGGLFLLGLSCRILVSKPAAAPLEARAGGLAADYASTLLLTLANPATILSFAAVFAGLGLGGAAGQGSGARLLVLGVFLGSALW